MTDRLWIGLVLALLLEVRHWTVLRWDFDDDACGRVWQFTSISIAVAAVLIWLDGTRYTALPVLLSWMPPLLLPMQFIQSYGMRDCLPLSSFSYLARQHRNRNLRLGLTEETYHFNFGNLLFAVSMVAASVGEKADAWFFLPAVVALTGWMLVSSGRCRLAVVVPMLALAGLLAVAGQIGLVRASDWLGGRLYGGRGHFDPNQSITLIGVTGGVEQSPDIVWRLRANGKDAPPPLLRTASFNLFSGTNWYNQRPAFDFKDLDTVLIEDRDYYLLLPSAKSARMAELPSFSLRGAATAESPLPLPGNVSGLSGFEFDGVERNSLGTVRVFPKQGVIEGTVCWNGGTNPETPPILHEDLRIPTAEREVIRDTVANLHLERATNLQGKLSILRAWFQENFRYTRQLTIDHPRGRGNPLSPLGRFLTDVRAGHCEYFASAAVLMLREAGIPTRYATGYAVVERDIKRGEHVIRGTHGHAWCRVWDADAGVWIDFDATPQDWFGASMPKMPTLQWLDDWVKRFQEDFLIWRNRPANRLIASLVMIAIGLALAAFIMKRLWRSKRRVESGVRQSAYKGPVIRTPLHAVETRAIRLLGPRPPGTPFAEWLARLRGNLPDAGLLDEAIALHQRLRFDPAPAPAALRERLAALAGRIESELRRRG